MQIKTLATILLIISLFLLVSCETLNLPESPKPPGRQGPFYGRAVMGLHAFPDWAAEPKNLFVYPEEVEFEDELRVKVMNYDYVYRFAYYFDKRSNLWEMFELEDGMKLKDWYVGRSARGDIDITRDIFEEGENYVVAYACNKAGDYFDCNENKWMLTFFKVVRDADFEKWIIEEDIGDFIFLTSKREREEYSGEELKVYIAEYMKDNDKAIVEITQVDTMSAAKAFLKQWNIFKLNYGDYEDSKISFYEDEDEYFVKWMSDDVAVKITFETDEFPTDLVDVYLLMWPSSEINFTTGTLPDDDVVTDLCGNEVVLGTEQCDPPESECVIKVYDKLEIREGRSEYAGGVYRITILDIIGGTEAIISVDGIAQSLEEGEIKEFPERGYVQVYRILGGEVTLNFGYTKGICSEQCQCTATGEIEQPIICTAQDECQNPGEDCIAASGLKNTCTQDCNCPEPIFPIKFCGDNVIDTPNTFRIMEDCDPPGPWPLVGVVQGTCTETCKFLPTGVLPTGCRDGFKVLPEQCDPPKSVCLKNGELGECNTDCDCDVFTTQPDTISALKQAICPGEVECWGIGETCDETGVCNADCECEGYCGDEEVTGDEECDPPGSEQIVEGDIVAICDANCQWEEVSTEEDELKLEYCGILEPECWPRFESCYDLTGGVGETTGEGICNETCECEIEEENGDDEETLKLQYCGTIDPECWPRFETCYDLTGGVGETTGEGICNEICECEIEEEPELGYCGDGELNLGEDCEWTLQQGFLMSDCDTGVCGVPWGNNQCECSATEPDLGNPPEIQDFGLTYFEKINDDIIVKFAKDDWEVTITTASDISLDCENCRYHPLEENYIVCFMPEIGKPYFLWVTPEDKIVEIKRTGSLIGNFGLGYFIQEFKNYYPYDETNTLNYFNSECGSGPPGGAVVAKIKGGKMNTEAIICIIAGIMIIAIMILNLLRKR